MIEYVEIYDDETGDVYGFTETVPDMPEPEEPDEWPQAADGECFPGCGCESAQQGDPLPDPWGTDARPAPGASATWSEEPPF